MVPRIQETNLRALTYSGVSRENAKYVSLSIYLSLFCLFVLFVFEKIELQHIVVFNLYKKQFFVISGGTGKTRHLVNPLVP